MKKDPIKVFGDWALSGRDDQMADGHADSVNTMIELATNDLENFTFLDVGCGKGFLLHEMIKIQPKLKIYGFDISAYAIKKSIKDKRINLYKHDARKKISFDNKFFDLTISINTLHNLQAFDLYNSIKEISRVSKKSFICIC